MHLGGERQCDSKVSCPRTQHNIPRPGLEPGLLAPESSALTMRPLRLPCSSLPTANFFDPLRRIKLKSFKDLKTITKILSRDFALPLQMDGALFALCSRFLLHLFPGPLQIPMVYLGRQTCRRFHSNSKGVLRWQKDILKIHLPYLMGWPPCRSSSLQSEPLSTMLQTDYSRR